jgi:hypothetical protein
MDLEQRTVMFATPGKDTDTVKAFAETWPLTLEHQSPKSSGCVVT